MEDVRNLIEIQLEIGKNFRFQIELINKPIKHTINKC